MGWRNKEDDVTLEELGFTSKDELKARLAKIQELETTNTTLNTTVQTQSGELNTVKATLADLEGKFNTLSERNQNQNNNNNNNNNNQHTEIPSVQDNEDAAFSIRMAPLYESTMQNTAFIIEDRTLRRIASQDPLFSKMETEIRELIQRTPLQMRANTNIPQGGNKSIGEQVIENAYYVVKGRRADQIRTDAIAGKGEFFVEPARSAGNTGSTDTGPKDKTVDTLTEEDKRVIAKMNIKPETYVKLINDGGPNMGGSLVNKSVI